MASLVRTSCSATSQYPGSSGADELRRGLMKSGAPGVTRLFRVGTYQPVASRNFFLYRRSPNRRAVSHKVFPRPFATAALRSCLLHITRLAFFTSLPSCSVVPVRPLLRAPRKPARNPGSDAVDSARGLGGGDQDRRDRGQLHHPVRARDRRGAVSLYAPPPGRGT